MSKRTNRIHSRSDQCIYIYIYIYEVVSCLTVVEGHPKASYSIVTTLRCRGGCYSFPWIASLTLDPYLIMLSVKQGGIKYHFLSLWYDSTLDWNSISRTIGEHSNHYCNTYMYIQAFATVYGGECSVRINTHNPKRANVLTKGIVPWEQGNS